MTDAVSSHCSVPSVEDLGLEDLVAAALGLGRELRGDGRVDVAHLLGGPLASGVGSAPPDAPGRRDHDLAGHPAVGVARAPSR